MLDQMHAMLMELLRGLDKLDSCMQFRTDDPHLYAEERRTSTHIIVCAGF